MAALFEVTDVDTRIYTEELDGFLPDRLIDAHTHVYREEDGSHGANAFQRVVSWPSRVAKDDPVEDLRETYRLMFPGRSVTPLMFTSVFEGDDMDRLNGYVAACAASTGYPALLYAHPSWDGAALERVVKAGGFRGVKVYLDLSPAYIPVKEIRIFDFLPPHQLDVLDRNGWVAMLHIPRDGRLRDPVNLAQMLEIEKTWPRVRLIIAHVGRAYCDEDVGDAFTVLAGTRRMHFDFSANTNDRVFEAALRTFGPERCLFGSDMPITRMRMRRVCENGRYVNIVPRGLYGEVSGDSHMREADPPEADSLTFFLYEEILAVKRAVRRIGLGAADVEAIFHGNAARLLGV
jgi:predicted TIM-barrel fold metal-dependent hydrolase